jgi:alpha-N-arabinofuranosidase
MFAALTPDRKFLLIAVVNATASEQKFDLDAEGVHLAGPSTLWQMTGESPDAANRVDQPPQTGIHEIAIGDVPRSITVAPISVNIYRFPVTQAAR